MSGADWIGWISSLALVATIARQVYVQWRDKVTEGISKWLYLGQLGAEVGFIWYALVLDNWVFAFTNAALLALNVLGLVLLLRERKSRA